MQESFGADDEQEGNTQAIQYATEDQEHITNRPRCESPASPQPPSESEMPIDADTKVETKHGHH